MANNNTHNSTGNYGSGTNSPANRGSNTGGNNAPSNNTEINTISNNNPAPTGTQNVQANAGQEYKYEPLQINLTQEQADTVKNALSQMYGEENTSHYIDGWLNSPSFAGCSDFESLMSRIDDIYKKQLNMFTPYNFDDKTQNVDKNGNQYKSQFEGLEYNAQHTSPTYAIVVDVNSPTKCPFNENLTIVSGGYDYRTGRPTPGSIMQAVDPNTGETITYEQSKNYSMTGYDVNYFLQQKENALNKHQETLKNAVLGGNNNSQTGVNNQGSTNNSGSGVTVSNGATVISGGIVTEKKYNPKTKQTYTVTKPASGSTVVASDGTKYTQSSNYSEINDVNYYLAKKEQQKQTTLDMINAAHKDAQNFIK